MVSHICHAFPKKQSRRAGTATSLKSRQHQHSKPFRGDIRRDRFSILRSSTSNSFAGKLHSALRTHDFDTQRASGDGECRVVRAARTGDKGKRVRWPNVRTRRCEGSHSRPGALFSLMLFGVTTMFVGTAVGSALIIMFAPNYFGPVPPWSTGRERTAPSTNRAESN